MKNKKCFKKKIFKREEANVIFCEYGVIRLNQQKTIK